MPTATPIAPRRRHTAALALGALLSSAAPLAAQPAPAHPAPALPAAAPPAGMAPLRVFVIGDAHSRRAHLARFIEHANRERPDLVLDVGDYTHDATETEFRLADRARAELGPPLHRVTGNHDARPRGPFTAPPPVLPPFRAFDHGNVRFILLDNSDGTIGDALFARLEADLEAHAARTIVVAMHVPPLLTRVAPLARLRHLAPFHVESPFMPVRAQAERFTALMARYGVLAVLTGHTHAFEHSVRDGTHYIVTGALGGLTPGLGIPNEYLDITIDGRRLTLDRVQVLPPARDPVTFTARAFRFYAELNSSTHRAQGWNHVPSASVQVHAALRRTERDGSEHAAVLGTAGAERNLGADGRQSLVADIGVSAGRRELATHLATGYRLRPIGEFNRGPFIDAAVIANAGTLGHGVTAGVGIQLRAGAAWNGIVFDVARGHATNHRATTIGLGHRF